MAFGWLEGGVGGEEEEQCLYIISQMPHSGDTDIASDMAHHILLFQN